MEDESDVARSTRVGNDASLAHGSRPEAPSPLVASASKAPNWAGGYPPPSPREPVSLATAYLLMIVPMAFLFFGAHRFYLGRPVSGFLYAITFGFFGIGTLLDLFLLPRMVEDENIRIRYRNERWLAGMASGQSLASGQPPVAPTLARPPETEEQAILRIAKDNGGRVTASMIAVETGMSLKRASRILNQLCKDGFAEPDVSTEGANLYVFPGLLSNKPFDVDAL